MLIYLVVWGCMKWEAPIMWISENIHTDADICQCSRSFLDSQPHPAFPPGLRQAPAWALSHPAPAPSVHNDPSLLRIQSTYIFWAAYGKLLPYTPACGISSTINFLWLYNLCHQINKLIFLNIKFFQSKNIHISWDAKESSGEAALPAVT